MAEISEELKRKLFQGGPEKVVRREQQSWQAGVVFILLAIVGDAINRTLGLESSNWILLGIATWILGLGNQVIAYFGAKEG